MSKTIGVIGGLGPAATLDFFAKLVAATPAACDQDHLRVLIDSNPHVPDRNLAIIGKGPSPGPLLAQAARGLEIAGAEVVVMACNTAHAFQPEIEAALGVPFLSMIDATVDAAMARRPRRVGLLAADGCLNAGLYQRAFAAQGVEALHFAGEEQSAFMRLIYRAKSGDLGESAQAQARRAALSLVDRGADLIVAACTEVPLVLSADKVPVPLTSSTDALVARVVAFAREEKS